MEQFSRAYIGAIAAQAGCNSSIVAVDNDSIDMILLKKDISGCIFSRAQIDIQLKSSYTLDFKENYFSFPLPVKNYNDLRISTANPRLLVIVHIPENCEDWTTQTNEQLCLHHCAYWKSLLGQPETNNSTTISGSVMIYV